MAVLAQKTHTAGNRRRWRVSYEDWLEEGVTVASAVVSLTDVTIAPLTGASVDTSSVDPDGHVIFWTNGGVVNEVFTINVAMTNSSGEIKKDTIGFTVIAP